MKGNPVLSCFDGDSFANAANDSYEIVSENSVCEICECASARFQNAKPQSARSPAEKRKGKLCHWNIHPESKLTILKIAEIAETVQQAASCKKTSAASAQPPRIVAVLDLTCNFQQVLVLT
jgi:hypothetical protein